MEAFFYSFEGHKNMQMFSESDFMKPHIGT